MYFTCLNVFLQYKLKLSFMSLPTFPFMTSLSIVSVKRSGPVAADLAVSFYSRSSLLKVHPL